jgi:hypothetical protein
MKPLWALHVIGPDDVYAAPSWAEASEAAAWLEHHEVTKRPRGDPDMPRISFAVIPWPRSTDAHAAELGHWSRIWPVIAVARESRDPTTEKP